MVLIYIYRKKGQQKQSPETDPHVYGHFIYDKVVSTEFSRKIRDNSISEWKIKKNPDPYNTSHRTQKIN